ADLDTFWAEIYVMDIFGNEIKTVDDIRISVDYGNKYYFSLTGDASNYFISEMDNGD
ncbi:MAG: hypothetical protein HFE63_09150, partial [Clostridiales bacterium]|nr:hypothetical protein [Clostridiales bacterium]